MFFTHLIIWDPISPRLASILTRSKFDFPFIWYRISIYQVISLPHLKPIYQAWSNLLSLRWNSLSMSLRMSRTPRIPKRANPPEKLPPPPPPLPPLPSSSRGGNPGPLLSSIGLFTLSVISENGSKLYYNNKHMDRIIMQNIIKEWNIIKGKITFMYIIVADNLCES